MGFIKDFFKSLLDAQESIVGLNQRNYEFIYKLNKRADYPLANDKVQAKAFLNEHGIPTPETFHVYEYLFDLDNLHDELQKHPTFVVKPANGSKGNGILIIDRHSSEGYFSPSGKHYTEKDIGYFIASIIFGKFSMGHQDAALVERKLTPCKELYPYSQTGLFDIRVLVIEEKITLAMLRIPTNESGGKANLHQGGIGIGIDMKTGLTTLATLKEKKITHHPDNQLPLSGVQIPHWPQIMEISQKIAAISPLKYIGIDLTIDEAAGPVVIEFNARPGLEIQNANAIGIKELL